MNNWQKKCVFFKNFDEAIINQTICPKHLVFKSYKKGETIAHEGDECHAIGIVKQGAIEIQTIYPSGKVLTHVRLVQGNVFGEAIIFNAKKTYPVTITAIEKCEIGYIHRQDLLTIFHDYPQALKNYLTLMSNRLMTLNKKIRHLSLDTLDKRVANFLLQTYKTSGNKLFSTGLSRKAMAEMMGVQRPSLSRCLVKMKNDGVIDFDGDSFKIVNLEALENILA